MSKKYLYEFRDESLEFKTLPELLVMCEFLFDERDAYNVGKGAMNCQESRGDSRIIEYFQILGEVKKCVEENRFTDGFEQAMKLKLYMTSHSSTFNILVGDYELAHLCGAMTKLVTSRFFDTLEKIENRLKLEGSNITKLLE